jgi:hypothetical protein
MALAILILSTSAYAKGGGGGHGGGHASAHSSAHATESAHVTEGAHTVEPAHTTSSRPFWMFWHSSSSHCDDKTNKDCKQ